MNKDVNFDDLADHFQKRIYGSRKGDIRLAVLERDLNLCIPQLEQNRFRILDIGAGLAQMGLSMAKAGHQVCINDISKNMLELAKESALEQGIFNQILWKHSPFQALADGGYDLIMCHAVLEWLDQPETLIGKLHELSGQTGLVSLMFYNFDALVFHNLIRGNFKKIQSRDFSGMQGGLTPPNPLKADWVEEQLKLQGFEVFYRSGIRVFSDYTTIQRGGNASDDDVISMELHYSNKLPYLNMGRYIHFMCRKSPIV